MTHFTDLLLVAILPSLVWMAEGRAEAERDIATNTMKWKIYGHLAGMTRTDEAARAILRKRFGVELEVVAFCVVTREQLERANSYNDRIREEVDLKHGANSIYNVWEEAYQNSRYENVIIDWLLKCLIVAGVLGSLWICRKMLMRMLKTET